MWVYKRTESGLWTVGFYAPIHAGSSAGTYWQPESDHDSAEKAAARVHYLNGGSRQGTFPAELGVVHESGGG